ncbi:hypothetical protein [Halioxenophilus sp. WMMB6]|uniref:hypothetical protein n=1 Tax=Halioxenophilus sp. WMMB6 TaxID=3073815 RepID=UPI00295E3369|nr:hypothetical protein [Halioxenophilus sp. WMMB6]
MLSLLLLPASSVWAGWVVQQNPVAPAETRWVYQAAQSGADWQPVLAVPIKQALLVSAPVREIQWLLQTQSHTVIDLQWQSIALLNNQRRLNFDAFTWLLMSQQSRSRRCQPTNKTMTPNHVNHSDFPASKLH